MKVVRRSRLTQIITATEEQAKRAVSLAVKEAEEVMNLLVPVDEGDLKSTIEKDDPGTGKASIKAGGKSKKSEKFVDYESHVEFGTTHFKKDGSSYTIPAQPFFRPGVEAGRKKMKAEMKIVDK